MTERLAAALDVRYTIVRARRHIGPDSLKSSTR